MRIAYVNPAYGQDFVRSARWAAKSRGRVQRHPEQALIQIAVLENAGHTCTFIEGAARNMTEQQAQEEIKKFSPDLAIIHTTTPSIYNDINYARRAKEISGCKTVLVGAHASAVPKDTLEKSGQAIDIIVRGEADYTLRDIANGLPLKDIPGISYFEDGKIVHNASRPYLDVNELPFPAWKHIDPHWYHDAGKLYPFLTLYTGRGCFGLCTFCRETQVINGRELRMRDFKKVVDEIEYDLKLFPYLREIMFETDTFTAVPRHVREICEEIIRRGLHKKISWSCNVRVDIELDLLPLMKKAGCRMLMIGFEFGTNKQLTSVRKGTTIELGREFAETAHKLGFTLHGCFMIGAPDETKSSAQKTIDYAKSLPLDTIQVSGIAVYPGTEFYKWAKQNDFITARDWTDWVDKNQEQVTLLSYPQMSKSEIDFYIDKALREFYLRPKQIWQMLLAIRSWDDVKRKVYGFKSFLNYFKKNKRKINESCSHCGSI
jgi:anaerobic magnesium-protoporphyrin IX monomethyl ester cyclase